MTKLQISIRAAWAFLSVAVFWLAVCLPLTILGFPLTVLGVALRRVKISPVDDRIILAPPRLLWLWGNDQEGYNPRWYRDYRASWPRWFMMWEWAAWRNSVNNLRFVRWLNPPHTSPDDFEQYHARRFSLYWSGWRYRIIIDMPNGKNIMAGWKWSQVPQPWQRLGVGFGIRVKRVGAPVGDWQG